MESFTILDGIDVPMRDGCRLKTDIWLPGEGSWPVLLQRTPYGRDNPQGSQVTAGLTFQAALREGFAVAVQDTRGRYASEGAGFVPFRHEGGDGVDTIDWLRRQPFCNGSIGMFGASYVGATQVLAAALDPPGLVSIAPQITTARHAETWCYRDGAVELGFLLLWIIEALGADDLDRRHPAEARALLNSFATDPASAFSRLPILDADLLRIAPYAQEWFDATRARGAPALRETLDTMGETKAAALVIGAWNDLFIDGSIELFETLRKRTINRGQVRDRLIVGPWSHGNPTVWQGDTYCGPQAAIDLSAEQLAFTADAMSGQIPGTPVVRYFRGGSNTWHSAPDWPLPGSQPFALHLDGTSLNPSPAWRDWSRAFVSDPLNPVPTVGGATFLPGLALGRNSGPKDQAVVESRPDVVVFTSDALVEELEVTGLVTLSLTVTSDAPTCDWTARLCVVSADGMSLGLTDGIKRWTNPGAASLITIRLVHTSHLFRRGDRIRLQVASTNFPRFDRNPQSGEDPAHAAPSDFKVARNQIVGHGDTCHLTLPRIPIFYDQYAWTSL